MKLNERIAQARERANMTLRELGAAVEPPVSYEAVRQWESGESTPRRKRIAAIATATKVSEVWLQTGFGPMGTNESATATEIVSLFKSVDRATRLEILAELARGLDQ